jgi:hypothetical protein
VLGSVIEYVNSYLGFLELGFLIKKCSTVSRSVL